MSLLTYESTRPRAAAIPEVVKISKTLPWSTDAPHIVFAGDPSVKQNKIDLISAWVQAIPNVVPAQGPSNTLMPRYDRLRFA